MRRWKAWLKQGVAVVLLAACLACILFALFGWAWTSKARRYELRASAGSRSKTRYQVLEYVVDHGRAQQLYVQAIETRGSADALNMVEDRELDVALVQGGLRVDHLQNVRQVCGLYVEPLHLLVRSELYDDATRDLAVLVGKRVNVSSDGSGTSILARSVLSFAGLQADAAPEDRGYVPTRLGASDLLSVLNRIATSAESDRQKFMDELPDAVFVVTTLPSKLAKELVDVADYRVVPLRFGEAYSLLTIKEEEQGRDPVEPRFIQQIVIPEFTYGVSPAVPAAPCPTLGTRLLFVAHKDVPVEPLRRMLEMVFSGPLENLYRPPALEKQTPELPWHDAAIAFRERNAPLLRSEFTETVQRFAVIAGPLFGSILALYGYLRWRRVLRFEAYFNEVFRVEMLARGVFDDDATMLNGPATVQNLEELLDTLRNKAVADFSRGYFRGEGVVFTLLTHIAEARKRVPRWVQTRDEVRASLLESRNAQLKKRAQGQPGNASPSSASGETDPANA